MSVNIKNIELFGQNDFIHLKITGKLNKQDYEQFAPELDRLITQYGKINLLVELIDFHGWTAGAAWEDTKFGFRHFNDIRRLAIIGDSIWENGMALFCKIFTRAEVKYFDLGDRKYANAWVSSGQEFKENSSVGG